MKAKARATTKAARKRPRVPPARRRAASAPERRALTIPERTESTRLRCPENSTPTSASAASTKRPSRRAHGQAGTKKAAARKAPREGADDGAVVRDPGARRAAPALRLPSRTRRHAQIVGGAEGTEPRSVGEAARGACRGSSARLRLVRRRDSRGQLRRGQRDRVGSRDVGAAVGQRRRSDANPTRRASSSSGSTAKSCTAAGRSCAATCAATATRSNGC